MAFESSRGQCVFTSDERFGPWDRVRREDGEPRPHEPADAEVFKLDPLLAYYIREFSDCDEAAGALRCELIGMYGITVIFPNGSRNPLFFAKPLRKTSRKAPWLRAVFNAEMMHQMYPKHVQKQDHLTRYVISDRVLAMP